MTAAQTIIVAMHRAGIGEYPLFTERDLAVIAWQLAPERFGIAGSTQWPDTKKLSTCLHASAFTSPIKRGWIERAAPGRYRLTREGEEEARKVLGE